MDMEHNRSTIKIHTKDNTAKVDSMEKGGMFGHLATLTKDNFMKDVSTAEGYGHLSLDKSMKEATSMTKKAGVENTDGATVVYSKDSFKVTKSNYHYMQKR